MPERDIFANFERMRREMDELFGGVFDRSLAPHRRAGFTPRVDVSYVGDPPRAIVTAELAGVDIGQIDLEVRGRELIISGNRGALDESEGRVYQQIEIEHGPFRRAIQLGADVAADEAKATYEDGVLRVELPLRQPDPRSRSVPIEVPDRDGEGRR
ncbi:MAG: Hsp20/alpha crystallin family protein [Solirubrobacteraceae bacterium]|nr:Hsp20/alpha crystallin family protein [Solirubrobacteraceae bacterium]